MFKIILNFILLFFISCNPEILKNYTTEELINNTDNFNDNDKDDKDSDNTDDNNSNNSDDDNDNSNNKVVILITPSMPAINAVDLIESASVGDIIELAPGKYSFRLYLSNPGVTIRAQNSIDKPIIDYTEKNVNLFPGSLPADDWKARHGINIQADNIILQDLVIKNAHMPNGVGSGIYVGPLGVIKEPASPGTLPKGVVLRRLEITGCDDGINAAALELLIDNCNLHHNGTGNKGEHNIYIQGGGIITIKDSTLTHPIIGQNVNTRAQKTIIENSILGPIGSFQTLLNTPKATMVKGVQYEQRLIIRNCEIHGVRHNGLGLSKAYAIDNGSNYVGLSQYIELYNNTYTGAQGNTGVVIALYRRSGHTAMGVTSKNNTYQNYKNFLYLKSGTTSDPFYSFDINDVEY